VQGALQQWLSDLIQVAQGEVRALEASLSVTLVYTILRSQERRQEQFALGGRP